MGHTLVLYKGVVYAAVYCLWIYIVQVVGFYPRKKPATMPVNDNISYIETLEIHIQQWRGFYINGFLH